MSHVDNFEIQIPKSVSWGKKLQFQKVPNTAVEPNLNLIVANLSP